MHNRDTALEVWAAVNFGSVDPLVLQIGLAEFHEGSWLALIELFDRRFDSVRGRISVVDKAVIEVIDRVVRRQRCLLRLED